MPVLNSLGFYRQSIRHDHPPKLAQPELSKQPKLPDHWHFTATISFLFHCAALQRRRFCGSSVCVPRWGLNDDFYFLVECNNMTALLRSGKSYKTCWFEIWQADGWYHTEGRVADRWINRLTVNKSIKRQSRVFPPLQFTGVGQSKNKVFKNLDDRILVHYHLNLFCLFWIPEANLSAAHITLTACFSYRPSFNGLLRVSCLGMHTKDKQKPVRWAARQRGMWLMLKALKALLIFSSSGLVSGVLCMHKHPLCMKAFAADSQHWKDEEKKVTLHCGDSKTACDVGSAKRHISTRQQKRKKTFFFLCGLIWQEVRDEGSQRDWPG